MPTPQRYLLALALAALAPASVQSAEDPIWGMTRLHTLHLSAAKPEWDALSTTVIRQAPATVAAAERETDFIRADGRLVHRSGGFGNLFPWIHAQLRSGDQVFPDVGVRYKGNFSYQSSERMLRRNLKIKTELFGDGPSLAGNKTLNFNAGALDPSRIRETLSYAAFAAAGVPSPRTAYAQVYLSVPGVYANEFLGVYTMVEQINGRFLRRHFTDGEGLLLKPEGVQGGVTYYGEDWSAYGPYNAEREPTPAEAGRFIQFAWVVNKADDALFRASIGHLLEVDRFLGFIAVNALLANMDSFLGGRHNFYLYLDNGSGRITFLPWDQDLSMGGMGNPNFNVLHPIAGQQILIQRILAVPEYREKYVAIIHRLSAGFFSDPEFIGRINGLENVLKDPLEREARAAMARGEVTTPVGARGGHPREFALERIRTIEQQIAAEKEKPGAPIARQ